MRRLTRALLCTLALTGPLVYAAHAQQWGRNWRMDALRDGVPERRGGFTFCRLQYSSVRSEAGGQGWWTDYPASDANFMLRLSQLTRAQVSRWNDGELAHAVVSLGDTGLFECPFLFASDVGTTGLTGDEAGVLREYLLKGGFLWADDFWGDRAWQHWSEQLRRVLPEYDVIDLPITHPIFATGFNVERVPQIPSIQYWRRSGGYPSERGAESAQVNVRAIMDGTGRILVLMTHNTDIADGWEREGEDVAFFESFSWDAYAVGINVALWVLTH
jgi:hypothetical protein